MSDTRKKYQVAFRGAAKTGKSRSAARMSNPFTFVKTRPYVQTHSCDVASVNLNEDKKLEIIDIGSRDVPEQFLSQYTKDCQAQIFYYDIERPETLKAIKAEIKKFKDDGHLVVLVANKADKFPESIEMPEEEKKEKLAAGKLFAEEIGIPFYCQSAFDDFSEDVFTPSKKTQSLTDFAQALCDRIDAHEKEEKEEKEEEEEKNDPKEISILFMEVNRQNTDSKPKDPVLFANVFKGGKQIQPPTKAPLLKGKSLTLSGEDREFHLNIFGVSGICSDACFSYSTECPQVYQSNPIIISFNVSEPGALKFAISLIHDAQRNFSENPLLKLKENREQAQKALARAKTRSEKTKAIRRMFDLEAPKKFVLIGMGFDSLKGEQKEEKLTEVYQASQDIPGLSFYTENSGQCQSVVVQEENDLVLGQSESLEALGKKLVLEIDAERNVFVQKNLEELKEKKRLEEEKKKKQTEEDNEILTKLNSIVQGWWNIFQGQMLLAHKNQGENVRAQQSLMNLLEAGKKLFLKYDDLEKKAQEIVDARGEYDRKQAPGEFHERYEDTEAYKIKQKEISQLFDDYKNCFVDVVSCSNQVIGKTDNLAIAGGIALIVCGVMLIVGGLVLAIGTAGLSSPLSGVSAALGGKAIAAGISALILVAGLSAIGTGSFFCKTAQKHGPALLAEEISRDVYKKGKSDYKSATFRPPQG